MLNKRVLSIFVLLCAVLLQACGDSVTEQSHVDHVERAKVYQEQGQYKAAVIEYKNALKKSGGSADVVVKYAQMLNKLGQYSGALELLEELADKENISDNDQASYNETLVRTYQGMKKYRSANKLLEKMSQNLPAVQLLKANNSLGLGDIELSENAYKALLGQNEEIKNKARYGLALISARKGNVEESQSHIEKISKTDQIFIHGQVLKAGLEVSKHDLEAAEEVLTEALSVLPTTDIIEPVKASVLERLAYVLTRQGRSNEAYIYTKILSEAFPGASEVKEKYLSAVQSMQAGDTNAAKTVLLDILKEYPRYKLAQQLLGVINYLDGDNESASKYLSESVDPEVANEMTRHIYAATNLKMNEPKKVLEILEPNIANTKTPETLALYGLAAISDGQHNKGEKALLKAVSLDEDNISLRLALADFYRDGPKADKDKEWQQLDSAFRVDTKNLEVLKTIVSYHLRNEDLKAAQEFVASIVKANPKGYSAQLVAGYFFLNRTDLEKAYGHFKVASEVAASEGVERLNALSSKGRVEILLKKYEDAKSTFHAVIHEFPDSELGYKGLLSVYLMDKNGAEGRRQLESLAQQNVKSAPYYVLIKEAISQGDASRAKSYVEKAEAAHSEDDLVRQLNDAVTYLEAQISIRESDFNLARSKVAEILTRQPDNIRLLSFLVDLELKAGRIKEAEKVLAQMESINSNLLVISLLKSDVAIAKQDFPLAKSYLSRIWAAEPVDAVASKLYRVMGTIGDRKVQSEFLEEWLAKIPNSMAATLYQSIGYQKRGQRIKAAEGYERVLQQQPDNVMALNNLGWIYFEKKDPRALEILERAVSLAPENAAVLDSYGWALVDAGQVSNGIVYLEKAYSLAPDSKEIKDHLDIARAKK